MAAPRRRPVEAKPCERRSGSAAATAGPTAKTLTVRSCYAPAAQQSGAVSVCSTERVAKLLLDCRAISTGYSALPPRFPRSYVVLTRRFPAPPAPRRQPFEAESREHRRLDYDHAEKVRPVAGPIEGRASYWLGDSRTRERTWSRPRDMAAPALPTRASRPSPPAGRGGAAISSRFHAVMR